MVSTPLRDNTRRNSATKNSTYYRYWTALQVPRDGQDDLGRHPVPAAGRPGAGGEAQAQHQEGSGGVRGHGHELLVGCTERQPVASWSAGRRRDPMAAPGWFVRCLATWRPRFPATPARTFGLQAARHPVLVRCCRAVSRAARIRRMATTLAWIIRSTRRSTPPHHLGDSGCSLSYHRCLEFSA